MGAPQQDLACMHALMQPGRIEAHFSEAKMSSISLKLRRSACAQCSSSGQAFTQEHPQLATHRTLMNFIMEALAPASSFIRLWCKIGCSFITAGTI